MLSLFYTIIFKPILYTVMFLGMALVVFHFYPYNINYKKFDKSTSVITFAANYVNVQTEPNITLRVVELNKPSADKPTIMFLHGFCESAILTWHKQLEFFSNQGYHVIAPDMRGYNDSSKPLDVDSYLPEKLMNDVEAVIKALTPNHKVVLVAHDWGAIVASWFAAARPQFVQRLILLNLGHMRAQERLIRGEIVGYKQFLKSWYIYYFQLPYISIDRIERDDYAFVIYLGGLEELGEQGLISRQQLELNKKLWDKQLRSAILYYRAFVKSTLTQPPMQLKPFQMPVLILFGEDDAYLCHESADLTMREYIAEPVKSKSKVIKLPKIGHWVTAQAPDVVNKHILEFVK